MMLRPTAVIGDAVASDIGAFRAAKSVTSGYIQLRCALLFVWKVRHAFT